MDGFDVVQLAHVEIYTPKPEETYWFFHDLLGMEETTREGQSVYLRGYEDFYHHSLKITEAPRPGLGHIAWRAASPQALERRVKILEHCGAGQGWHDGDLGHGPAYRFTTPDGHVMELLWEVAYYQAPPAKRSPLKSRPSRRPLRGIPVRRLDHVNCLCAEVAPNRRFMMEQLGFKLREQKIGAGGVEVGAWLSVSPLVHEIGLMRDATGSRGRFHHVAFWYGYPQHLSDLADLCSDYGIRIEAGPGKHGTTQAYFMYVFEPGGTRVELFGDTGYLIFDPDWKTVVWDVANESDLEKSTIWFGGRLPETFYTYGTPPVEA
ncbi:MAG: catechol 2,3-dioxygenase [Armatimonadetes bacterium]|nr:catechol 2,3-dioxygenase [Armatimonadota bacterium]MDW8154311.1 catechol 2,3-dioxygenase [Armatimonadota bacterium]